MTAAQKYFSALLKKAGSGRRWKIRKTVPEGSGRQQFTKRFRSIDRGRLQ
jgi:hypothetical protein